MSFEVGGDEIKIGDIAGERTKPFIRSKQVGVGGSRLGKKIPARRVGRDFLSELGGAHYHRWTGLEVVILFGSITMVVARPGLGHKVSSDLLDPVLALIGL